MRHKIFPLVFGISLAGLMPGISVAEDKFAIDVFELFTASRILLSPEEAPAPVTVLDRETIRASGFTEIHDLFRLVPGFQVADEPGKSPVVINHGLSGGRPARLLVMVDGTSVDNPLFGSVDWQELSVRIEDIDRIEVVRGPNQATYGAEAFQGVVNIITRTPDKDKGTSLTARYGENEIRELYLRTAGEFDGLSWRLSGSAREARNFEDLSPFLYQSPYQELEDIERYTLDLKASYRPSLIDEWKLQLGLTNGTDRTGKSVNNYTTPFYDIDLKGEFLQLEWQRLLGADSYLSLKYYHTGREKTERYEVLADDPELAPVAYLPIDDSVKTRRDGLQFQHNFLPRNDLKAAWGAGLRYDVVESPTLFYGSDDVNGLQWQLFGDLSWRINKDWLLNLGGMVERPYTTETLFSPRMSLNYTLMPRHTLRLSAGRGYRAPTMLEEWGKEAHAYSGGLADIGIWDTQDLDPEEQRFLELGYLGSFPKIGLKVNGRVFIEEYDKFMDSESCILDPESLSPDAKPCPFDPPPGYLRPLGFNGKPWLNDQLENGLLPRFGHYKAFIFYNSDDLRVTGGDLSLDWGRADDYGRFILSHAITHITAYGRSDKDVVDSAPTHSTSLLWMKSWPQGIDSSIGVYRVGYLKWPEGDDQASYVRWDARLSKAFGKPASGNEIAFTIQNMNKEHVEYREEFTPERRYFLSLTLGW